MKFRLFLSNILLVTVLLLLPNLLLAQGGNPFDPADFPCFPPPCIPIDGGISFLVAAGVALAGKKLYDNQKK